MRDPGQLVLVLLSVLEYAVSPTRAFWDEMLAHKTEDAVTAEAKQVEAAIMAGRYRREVQQAMGSSIPAVRQAWEDDVLAVRTPGAMHASDPAWPILAHSCHLARGARTGNRRYTGRSCVCLGSRQPRQRGSVQEWAVVVPNASSLIKCLPPPPPTTNAHTHRRRRLHVTTYTTLFRSITLFMYNYMKRVIDRKSVV